MSDLMIRENRVLSPLALSCNDVARGSPPAHPERDSSPEPGSGGTLSSTSHPPVMGKMNCCFTLFCLIRTFSIKGGRVMYSKCWGEKLIKTCQQKAVVTKLSFRSQNVISIFLGWVKCVGACYKTCTVKEDGQKVESDEWKQEDDKHTKTLWRCTAPW